MTATKTSTRQPRFCRHCGAALPPTQPRFCIECGGALENYPLVIFRAGNLVEFTVILADNLYFCALCLSQ